MLWSCDLRRVLATAARVVLLMLRAGAEVASLNSPGTLVHWAAVVAVSCGGRVFGV